MSAPHPTDTIGWRCRGCGCTDTQACPGGCHWVDVELCSACVQDPPVPAPLPLLRIGIEDWQALPDAVLPRCATGGGVTHDVYSATMYLSRERFRPESAQPLPAFVAVPQDLMAELQRALHDAQVQLSRAGRGLRLNPLKAGKACGALAVVAEKLGGGE
ncbi:hypothetical protein HXXDennis_15 [Xanthomonas phage HXX_Dennis]|nr:hypothetical protein CPT_Suso_015 [Stenotrophomonas phage Suso]UTQ79914.1 hypothetical protein HXXDennis_15 [Xanthomonas phage HXX_Dennis]